MIKRKYFPWIFNQIDYGIMRRIVEENGTNPTEFCFTFWTSEVFASTGLTIESIVISSQLESQSQCFQITYYSKT